MIREHKFQTEAEANAYVLGARDGIECADPDDDFHSCDTDNEPAVDPDSTRERKE